MKEQVLRRLLAKINLFNHASLVSLVRKFYRRGDILKVVNVIPDRIMMIDQDGRILLANNGADE
jgi:hypothetical protein